MKHVPLILVLCCLVSACMPMRVDSAINACPADGLADYAFYEGEPPLGAVIVPKEEDGQRIWTLSGTAYLECRYDDGSARLQVFPSSMKTCTAKGLSLTCRAWL